MKIYQSLLAVMLSSTLFVGCKKEAQQKEAPKNGSITYRLQFDTQGPEAKAGKIMQGTLSMTDGYVTTSGASFEGTYNGIGVVFGLTTTQTIQVTDAAAVLGLIVLPQGTYEKVKVGVNFTPHGDKAAMELTGKYEDGPINIPIVFRVDEPFALKISKQSPTHITDSPDFAAAATLAVAKLTEGLTELDLFTAQLTNGVLVISKDSNTSLYNKIYSNMQSIIDVELS